MPFVLAISPRPSFGNAGGWFFVDALSLSTMWPKAGRR